MSVGYGRPAAHTRLRSPVVLGGNTGWSVYGAPWLQPVATSGKLDPRRSRKDRRKPLPCFATGCRKERMVRRGSTVRVRQRAWKSPCARYFRSGRLAGAPVCGGYGAVYGALRIGKRRRWTPNREPSNSILAYRSRQAARRAVAGSAPARPWHQARRSRLFGGLSAPASPAYRSSCASSQWFSGKRLRARANSSGVMPVDSSDTPGPILEQAGDADAGQARSPTFASPSRASSRAARHPGLRRDDERWLRQPLPAELA
jgi:hypothetical protein